MKSATRLLPLSSTEFAARSAAHSGGVCGFVAEADDMRSLARKLADELQFVADRPITMISVDGGVEPMLAALDTVGDATALLFGFSALSADEWAPLDELRNRLQPSAGIVLLMVPSDLEHLQEHAPNLSSWLGGRVWYWSDDIPDVPAADVQRRLSALRAHFDQTDDQVLAAARNGTLPPDPEYAEWLILLGQGTLLG